MSEQVRLLEDLEQNIRGGDNWPAMWKLSGRNEKRLVIRNDAEIESLLNLILESGNRSFLQYILGAKRSYIDGSMYPQGELFRRQLILEDNLERGNIFMASAIRGAWSSPESSRPARDEKLATMVKTMYTSAGEAIKERGPKPLEITDPSLLITRRMKIYGKGLYYYDRITSTSTPLQLANDWEFQRDFEKTTKCLMELESEAKKAGRQVLKDSDISHWRKFGARRTKG